MLFGVKCIVAVDCWLLHGSGHSEFTSNHWAANRVISTKATAAAVKPAR